MKTLATVLFVMVIIVASFVGAQSAERSNLAEVTDAYEFPLRPGMPEWRDLESHAEMLNACQIPGQVLANMSTEGLVKSCLTYPMAYDFLAFDSYARGLNSVISGFNGLQELLRRRDAGSALLGAYRNMDPATTPNCGHADKRACRLQFMYVEMLLSQDPILSNLTRSEKRSLLEVCRANYGIRQRDANNGMMQFAATGYMMSRVLLSVGYEPFQREYQGNAELRSVLDGTVQNDRDALGEIITFVDRYLETTVREEESR